MNRTSMIGTSVAGFMLGASVCLAQESPAMKLPQPQLEGGRPLMQVLRERKSTREFGADKLPTTMLSNLLWAAFGINRPESGSRTAPSTHNWQVIDVYVATADGYYLYDAKSHALQAIATQDIRALTGTQDFAKDAPVNLIYVADFSRRDADAGEEDMKIAAAADAGFIGQNVYLFCASEGLASVVRGSIDKEALAKAMKLKTTQWIVLAQSVGYPKK
ncbi:MAG: SagB/ThcOx family dehydrogenase [Methylococcaceae bacterium]|nr:SagB/ThcOx family dehydrogenase [Methylococcaceae bacterium]